MFNRPFETTCSNLETEICPSEGHPYPPLLLILPDANPSAKSSEAEYSSKIMWLQVIKSLNVFDPLSIDSKETLWENYRKASNTSKLL